MLHILEVKWKRNQNADMIYKDFYPFYASYANPMLYRGEKEQEEEFSLMKSYYPETARRIQEKVEEECDLLDYEGSWLYDEHPDRYMLYHLGRKIMDDVSPQVWKLCQTVFWRILFRCFYFTKYHADGAGDADAGAGIKRRKP